MTVEIITGKSVNLLNIRSKMNSLTIKLTDIKILRRFSNVPN